MNTFQILSGFCYLSLMALLVTGLIKKKFYVAFVFGGTALFASKLIGYGLPEIIEGFDTFFLRVIQSTAILIVVGVGFFRIINTVKAEQGGGGQPATRPESK